MTCNVDYEDTKDAAAAEDKDDYGNNDYDNDHDYDDSYLACIDAEPVKHLCQLASLLLKLIRLQIQR